MYEKAISFMSNGSKTITMINLPMAELVKDEAGRYYVYFGNKCLRSTGYDVASAKLEVERLNTNLRLFA